MSVSADDRPLPGGAPVTVRRVLAIAVPMMAAYVSIPVVGLIDTGAIGQTGRAELIVGVAVGSVVLDLVMAAFGFLRLATTGLTAQAVGRNDPAEVEAVLVRAAALALGFGLLVLALGDPIAAASVPIMAVAGESAAAATRFLEIRLLSMPLILLDMVLVGWMIGVGRAKLVLVLTTLYAIANAVGSLWFVLGFGAGVAGVAWAAVIAEALFCGLALFINRDALGIGRDRVRAILADGEAFRRLVAINGDIMVRSLVLLLGFALFTRTGGRFGNAVIAGNAVLMHLFLVAGFLLDGFAAAAEQLAGQAVGARDRAGFDATIRITLRLALAASAALAALFLLGGPAFVRAMTQAPDVRTAALSVLPYAALTPLLGAVAFLMDGIYAGATWTRDMRDMMLLSFALFVLALLLLVPPLGNHGLWIAFLLFLSARGVTFGLRLRRRANETFAA